MSPTDEMAAKRQSAAVAGSDDMRHKSDERLRGLLKNLEGTSDQRKPVELDEVILGIIHRLDDGTSKVKEVYDHLLAIENEMKSRGPQGGFARYLVAICIGAAATLAWQSYGELPKQIIAAAAPELGWSPEAKQMIASWVQQLGWTKPPAGPESAAVQPSVPGTQVATAEQTVPAAVVPKAPTVPSLDPMQVQQMVVQSLAALRESVQQLVAAQEGLGRTVDQLAASQDQMVHQIDMLQTSNQEILEKIPAPPPPLPATVAPTHKPTARTQPSSRAPTPPPHP
jgi:hypothetical protein